MRNLNKKDIYSSILDRFQNDEVFIRAIYKIAGQKNGANIWITSEQSILRTMPLQSKCYATQNCFIFGTIQTNRRKDQSKTRPDYRNTTRATVSMNKEAGQTQESRRSPSYRDDLDPAKLKWLIWLLHNWKWYFMMNRVLDSTSTRSEQEHASGNREVFTDSDQWKEN